MQASRSLTVRHASGAAWVFGSLKHGLTYRARLVMDRNSKFVAWRKGRHLLDLCLHTYWNYLQALLSFLSFRELLLLLACLRCPQPVFLKSRLTTLQGFLLIGRQRQPRSQLGRRLITGSVSLLPVALLASPRLASLALPRSHLLLSNPRILGRMPGRIVG